MLSRFFRNEKTELIDELITKVQDEMHRKGVLSDEYPTLMTHLERLTDIKAKERRPRLSRDTILIVAGNLLGIGLLVASEKKYVLNQKGFSLLLRPRKDLS